MVIESENTVVLSDTDDNWWGDGDLGPGAFDDGNWGGGNWGGGSAAPESAPEPAPEPAPDPEPPASSEPDSGDIGNDDGGNEKPGGNNGPHPQEIPSNGNSGENPGNAPGSTGGTYGAKPMEDDEPEATEETDAIGILDGQDKIWVNPETVTEQPEPIPAPPPSVWDSINTNWLIGGLLIAMVITVALILWPPKRKQRNKKR